MVECSVMTERMPELLMEAIGSPEREMTHLHIERCSACAAEWESFRQIWSQLGELPEVPLPAGARARFDQHLDTLTEGRVVPFRRRTAFKWLSQAAAVAVIAAGGYFAGHQQQPVTSNIASTRTNPEIALASAPFSLAESRVLPASQMNPDIEGRPQIENVQFVSSESDPSSVAVSFDMTSHVTVTGKPTDRSLVKLLTYVLQSQEHTTIGRSKAIDWVKDTYSGESAADPELVKALTGVLKNDSHEGVRMTAIDSLALIPAGQAAEARKALIEALQNDPNPAVRIKAVDALARLARSGGVVDKESVETLRKKASQPDENSYVRVKAAEALGQIDL